jgi:hypothetical protein
MSPPIEMMMNRRTMNTAVPTTPVGRLGSSRTRARAALPAAGDFGSAF